MDAERLLQLVGKKHDVDISLKDPMLVSATIFEALQNEALDNLGRMITKATEDIATTIVMAENSAHAKEEVLVTQAVRFGVDKIHLAGVDAATAVSRRVEKALARSEAAARAATQAAWVSGVSAGATLVAVIVLLVLIFR